MSHDFKIKLSEASKIYQKKDSRVIGIEQISLEICSGEILGLLGPNGAGKTTLLKLIATLIEPTSGDIYFNDAALSSLDADKLIAVKREIGYLPETPFVYSKLTGQEYLLYLGELYGVDRDILCDRLAYYFKLFEIDESKNTFLSAYSQGMLKKISLIAALINNQSILILDEPTNSLDPKMVTILKEILTEFKSANKTIILSTHILDIAEKLSDRIAILDKGKLKLVESIACLEKVNENGQRSRLEQLFLEITD